MKTPNCWVLRKVAANEQGFATVLEFKNQMFMILTNEEIKTAAEAWAGEFKTGEWFERLRIEAFEAGAKYFRQNSAKPIVSGSLPFSEVKSKILAGNAKSEYKQASIVMLRNIYSEAGAMTD